MNPLGLAEEIPNCFGAVVLLGILLRLLELSIMFFSSFVALKRCKLHQIAIK